MTTVFSWVRGIVFYLIFISLLYQILPGEKYKKYVHVCAGMIFVLVVMAPLLQIFHISDKLSYYTNLENFRVEARSLDTGGQNIFLDNASMHQDDSQSSEASRAYNEKISNVLMQYKNNIEKEVFAMFEETLLYPLTVSMTIDENENSDTFGCVQYLKVTVTTDAKKLSEVVDPVDSVHIQVEVNPDISADKENNETGKNGGKSIMNSDGQENTENKSDNNVQTSTEETHSQTNSKNESPNASGKYIDETRTEDTAIQTEIKRVKTILAQKLNMSEENIEILAT